MARQRIPINVKREVLTEAGYRCAVPTCRTLLVTDLHHITQVKDGGGNDACNLICLCPTCHALYHRKTISQESIRVWKMMLVSLNKAYDKEMIDYLLMLHRVDECADNDFMIVVSGDGLLRFSALQISGMINVMFHPWGRTGSNPCYEISLSDQGKTFIEAWKSGKSYNIEKSLGFIEPDEPSSDPEECD